MLYCYTQRMNSVKVCTVHIFTNIGKEFQITVRILIINREMYTLTECFQGTEFEDKVSFCF